MDAVLDVIMLGQRRFHELSLRGKVILSQLPLNLAMIFVCVISALADPDDFAHVGFIASQVLALLLLGACAAIPWQRLPQWSFLAIPVLDFYPIGLLRYADQDLVAGLGLLSVFPVMWLAGSGYRPRLAVAFGALATLLMVWVPLFMDGSADVHTLASVLLTPFIMFAIGVATSVMTLSANAQRERIQELLERSENREHLLDTVVETVDVGVVVIDADGRDLLMNAQHRELHRIALPQGVSDAPETELLVYRGESEELVPPHLRPAARAAAGETIAHELYQLGRGPSARTVSVSARPLRDRRGGAAASVMAFTDVTDVLAAVRARDSFVAAMSHEFRTPLTSLLGYAELLYEDASLSPAARADTLVMARNARHLNRMVDDILAAATPGTVEAPRLALDLAKLVRNAAASSVPEATSRQIALDVRVHGELPISADKTGIVRVLDNLISNALKYSDSGSTVTLTAEREGTWAVCRVADQGMGIPKDDLGRLFTRFHRSASAVRSGIPGTGLGLALAHEVAVKHGGDLECESEPGVGSVFTLRLPLG